MTALILIIEDNEPNLELMSYLLKQAGYDIIFALDGEQALHQIQTEKPDLILCDIHIPIINGLDFIKLVKRSNNDLAKIPIIAITAYAMNGDKEKFLAAGCDGYISKPIEPEDFVSQVTTYLKKNTP